MLPLAVVVLLAYIVGSIPTSLIVSKVRHGIDIREHGSGNAGGTNVIRVMGLKLGIAVIVFDIVKGYAATMLVPHLMYGPIPFTNRTPFEDFTVVQLICGSAAILGHVWTVFGGFRGGKGIATTGGMLLGLAPTEVLVSVIVFSIVFVASRYVSLGSISAAVVFPVTMFLRENVFHDQVQGYGTLIFFSIGICLLLIFTHRTNIKRLVEGTESRLTNLRLSLRRKHSSASP
jgi:glycerol-3-phosphate acyltransferase PlsY